MREISAIVCSCGGAPERVDATEEEEKLYGCGRCSCCVEAIACPKCGTRFTLMMEAPDVEGC